MLKGVQVVQVGGVLVGSLQVVGAWPGRTDGGVGALWVGAWLVVAWFVVEGLLAGAWLVVAWLVVSWLVVEAAAAEGVVLWC
jgi:hypothetical protein